MPSDRRRIEAARWRNVAGVWAMFLSGGGIFVANVTWERPFVERSCEPRSAPLPELCTNVRLITDSQWRSPVVITLLVVWAVSLLLAWLSWRTGQLRRNGAPPALDKRRYGFRSRQRIRLVGLLWLVPVSFSLRRGSVDTMTETYGPVCSSEGGLEVCRLGTAVVEQTVFNDDAMSAWPQIAAWLLMALVMCCWAYVIAAENLSRRFGEENLWREALRRRKESIPDYPVQQQRGNRY